MRIVILSTETAHHTYFINTISREFDVAAVFYETKPASFPYDVASPFARQEEDFERENFFKDTPNRILAPLSVYRVGTVNSLEFTREAEKIGPALGLVFGCGRIEPRIFSVFTKGLINVHRGIAPKYRGLDSDLWAIRNDDFENIGVTLHYVEEGLDTGNILAMEHVKYYPQDKIYHLRYKTTVMAANMMLNVIKSLSRGEDAAVKQPNAGKYYSAMPSPLKRLCQEKFERYIWERFKEKCAERI